MLHGIVDVVFSQEIPLPPLYGHASKVELVIHGTVFIYLFGVLQRTQEV